MKRLAACLALTVLLFPAATAIADVGAYGTTLIRFEERSIPGYDKQRVAPATQFLGIDADKVGDQNLSIHFYGWGRVDLDNQSTAGSRTDGDLTYGYLSYRFPQANAAITLGRFFQFDGVSLEQMDGVRAQTDLAVGFTLSLAGGVPVRLDRSGDNKGDYLFNGRLAYRIPSLLEIGVSSLYEKGLTSGPTADLKDYWQLVGGDLWFSPLKMVEARGRLSYSTGTGGIADQSWLLTVKPADPLTIAGEYNQTRFKDAFAATNLRSLFNPDTGDQVKYYGGSVTYAIAKPVEVTASYRHYDRQLTGKSDRYGADARITMMDGGIRAGLSYYRLEAATGINSYHETRGYLLYDKTPYVASLDLISDFYDQSIFGKKTAFEVLASAGYRFLENLTLSGDMSYGQNPRYNDEVKGLVRLTFAYTALKGAGK